MRWTRQRWRANGVAGRVCVSDRRATNGASTPSPKFWLAAHGRSSVGEVAAYGEVVWSWHPLLMPSLAEAKPAQPGQVAVNPLGDGDKKEFVAEESTKETVKTIARGKPGDLRCTRGDYRVLTTNAHGLRVLRAPGFPCSLFNRGTMFMQTSGKSCREKAKVRVLSINAPPHTAVMLRLVRNCALGRGIQNSRDAGAGNEKPRRTGYPAFAGYDGHLFCRRAEACGDAG